MRATLQLLPLPSVALLFLACAGGGVSSSATTPTSPIAGRYKIAVELGENSCGPVTVLPQPTAVRHKVGNSRFTLIHGANSFSATLAADNSFVADDLVLHDQDGSTLTVRLRGRISTDEATNLEANVTVDVAGRSTRPANCRYVVRWTGPLTGR